VRAPRLLLALGVVVVGLCAAWPFRQTHPIVAKAASASIPFELMLRRTDVPLELAPRLEVSPATGLAAVTAAQPVASDRPLRTQMPDLGNLAPAPALPVSFQPQRDSAPTSDWRPQPVARAPQPKAKPRPYRLRDGDTLEKIAERFLDNRQRANEVFEANRDVLARPDLLPVGATIFIPPRQNAGELEPVGGER
jgi:nucleoid-associated protein YgaU